jgi:hypothetical protein
MIALEKGNPHMVKAAAHFATFILIGVILSVLIGLWYTHSPNYCRDCNTGIGICMFGFFLSVPITLVVIYFDRRGSRKNVSANHD